MAVVVDTSVLIDFERAMERGRSLPPMPVELGCISVVTFAELLLGAELAPSQKLAARRRHFAETIKSHLQVLGVDADVARAHATLRASIPRGITLESHDLWIAATAIANGFMVYTFNIRDFERMPGLTLHALSFA